MTNASNKLTLSVAICAHNEQDWIGRTLASLMQQTRLPDEIIIVDNNSTDQTVQVIQRVIDKHPDRNMKIVAEGKKGLHHARETAWRSSQGDVVVSTDADITFPPDWLATIEQKMSDPAMHAITGICRYTDAHPVANWITGMNDQNRAKAEHTHLNGGNSAIRRPVLEEIDGYLGKPLNDFEDQWLSKKIQEAGYKIRFMPDLKVWHTFRRFQPDGVWGYIKYIFFYTAENIYPDHLSDESPYSVAVVLPTQNAAQSITQSLDSLYQQTPLLNEIIIVDCGSTDTTMSQVQAFRAKHPDVGIKVESAPGKSLPEAHEIGWRAAKSDLIIQANPQDIFPKGWLAMIHAAFICHPQLGAIVGERRVEHTQPLSWITQTVRNLWIRWQSRAHVQLLPTLTVYKRDVLEKLDAQTSQTPHEQSRAIQALGYTLRFKPEIHTISKG